MVSSLEERKALRRLKCHLTNHDWVYHRAKGERECYRCREVESYDVDETHEDPSAEKRETKFVIEDEQLIIQKYNCTGHSEDTEYWQWFPIGYGEITEENLVELKENIENYLQSKYNV
jgi:hypothetical protein